MGRLHLLKGKYGQRFLGLPRRLIHQFSNRITSPQCSLLFETS